jgi:hypothetical protein
MPDVLRSPTSSVDAGAAPIGDPSRRVLPTEQAKEIPVPLYVELPPGSPVEEVRVHYKPFGSVLYLPMAMQRYGDGFAALLPCEASQSTGHLKLFITWRGADGAVQSIGTNKEPLHVVIKNELDGEPPALPGSAPPGRCPDECIRL